ncbi:MAG: right-handed parallel beta-helix repeat-containing protein [Thermodesulfobacteriota bacterium]
MRSYGRYATRNPCRTAVRVIPVVLLLLGVAACRGLILQHVQPLEIPGFNTILVSDTVWKKGNSPCRIMENIFILPEVTLTIEPGVQVLLAPGVQIRSQGRIIAEGTAAEPIRIGPLGREPWDHFDCFGGWLLEDGSLPVNLFRHCIIEGGRGITIRAAAVHIEDCILRNHVSSAVRIEYGTGKIIANRISDNSTVQDTAAGNGAGIMVYTDKSFLIADNHVYGNQSSGGRDGGGGIFAFAYDTGTVAVRRNLIEKNRSDRYGGGLVAYACRVEDNRVFDNQADHSGGGIYAVRSTLKNNQVQKNRADCGGGVYAEKGILQGNTVADNQAAPGKGSGLFYFGEGCIENNTFLGNTPPHSQTGETIAVSGNPLLTRNNIIAPGGYAVRVQTHSLATDLNAMGNYWGTADPAIIDALIFDWLKDSNVGLVDRRAPAMAWITEAPPALPGGGAQVDRVLPPPSPEVLSGAIVADQVIGSVPGRPLTVSGNLFIAENATVRILPGAVLHLAPGSIIRTRGVLQAEGEASRPILFTGSSEQPWGHLLFERKSLADAASSDPAGENRPADQSGILRHCIIEHGRGIVMEETGPRIQQCLIRDNLGSGITIRNAAVTIHQNRIMRNRSPSNGGGIYAYGSRPIRIQENAIEDNQAEEDGAGIFAYGYHSNTAVNILNNRIENNRGGGDGGGVWASRAGVMENRIENNQCRGNGGGIFSTFALVENNDIFSNRAEQGGGVFAEANSSLNRNRISDNRISGKHGGAAYLNFWGVSIKNENFTRNRVVANQSAIHDGVGGIYLNGAMVFEYNDIYGNSGFQLFNANPAGQPAFEALQCFWGGPGGVDIEELIFDGVDDPSLATVRYQPCRTEPVEQP